MLLCITDRCCEQCTHCFREAHPAGLHMDNRVWIATLDFIKRSRINIVLVSGGEPTEHPRFEGMVEELLQLPIATACILSNGSFIFDDVRRKKVFRLLTNARVHLQVCMDPRYYKNADKVKQFPWSMMRNTIAFDKVHSGILPMGRASQLHEAVSTTRSPTCANLYLLAKQLSVSKFSAFVLSYEMRTRRFCTPAIDPAGNIRAGEGNRCTILGNVTKYDDEKTMKTLREGKPCDICGLMKNVPPAAAAILKGE